MHAAQSAPSRLRVMSAPAPSPALYMHLHQLLGIIVLLPANTQACSRADCHTTCSLRQRAPPPASANRCTSSGTLIAAAARPPDMPSLPPPPPPLDVAACCSPHTSRRHSSSASPLPSLHPPLYSRSTGYGAAVALQAVSAIASGRFAAADALGRTHLAALAAYGACLPPLCACGAAAPMRPAGRGLLQCAGWAMAGCRGRQPPQPLPDAPSAPTALSPPGQLPALPALSPCRACRRAAGGLCALARQPAFLPGMCPCAPQTACTTARRRAATHVPRLPHCAASPPQAGPAHNRTAMSRLHVTVLA